MISEQKTSMIKTCMTEMEETQMPFYKNPEEMYRKQAARFERDANCHYAQAKNGEGDYHYGKAKKAYKNAEECLAKAEESKGKKWKTRKKSK